MKKIIIIAALALTACAGKPLDKASDRIPVYADALYAVARVAGQEAVRLDQLSPEKFAELDARAQILLAAIHLGSATIEQLRAVTDEMRGAE